MTFKIFMIHKFVWIDLELIHNFSIYQNIEY